MSQNDPISRVRQAGLASDAADYDEADRWSDAARDLAGVQRCWAQRRVFTDPAAAGVR